MLSLNFFHHLPKINIIFVLCYRPLIIDHFMPNHQKYPNKMQVPKKTREFYMMPDRCVNGLKPTSSISSYTKITKGELHGFHEGPKCISTVITGPELPRSFLRHIFLAPRTLKTTNHKRSEAPASNPGSPRVAYVQRNLPRS